MNRIELKTKAKETLKGKTKDAAILFAIYFFISYAIGFTGGMIGEFFSINEKVLELILNIISLIIEGFLFFGFTNYFLKLSRNEEVTYKELFNKTELWIAYIAITLLTNVLITLWTLLLIIPGIIASIAYSQVYFIKLDHPELSTLETIKKSKQMMDGHKADFFLLEFSFLGWIILGLFTFGILYLWIIPYMQLTLANFYNELKEKNTSSIV